LAGLLENVHLKVSELDKLESRLQEETTQNKTLHEQLQRLHLEETQNQQRDHSVGQEVHELQLTLV